MSADELERLRAENDRLRTQLFEALEFIREALDGLAETRQTLYSARDACDEESPPC